MNRAMGRLGIASVVASAFSVLAMAPAQATLIDYAISFSVPTIAPVGDAPFSDPFTPSGGPVKNLAGSFTLQFDDSADAFGLLASFDITTTSGHDEGDFGFMGFRYLKAFDRLALGNCDAVDCTATPGTPNIIISIFGATGGSAFVNSISFSLDDPNLQYNAFDDPSPPFGTDNFITETVSFAPVPLDAAPVAEPASLSLMAAALGALALARRRRHTAA